MQERYNTTLVHVAHSFPTILRKFCPPLFATLRAGWLCRPPGRRLFGAANQQAPHSLNLVHILVCGCSGGVLVVHLGSMVVRLGVGVKSQLVVFPGKYPQEVGVIAEPEHGRWEDARKGNVQSQNATKPPRRQDSPLTNATRKTVCCTRTPDTQSWRHGGIESPLVGPSGVSSSPGHEKITRPRPAVERACFRRDNQPNDHPPQAQFLSLGNRNSHTADRFQRTDSIKSSSYVEQSS